MSLTISPSPFGSLVVSVAETGSTLSVTTVATSPAVLSMALGVPGPQGEAGEPGANGQGVAAGGLTNQALVKLSNSDYDTGWATITSGGGTWGSITGTLSDQTDLYDALNGKLSLSGGTMSGDIIFPVDVNNNDSAIGPWGFGVENINAGQSASIEPNQISITTEGVGTAITSSGITFPDATTQSTAGLPLTGGTLNLNDPSTFSAYIKDIDGNNGALVRFAYGDGAGGQGGYIALNNIDGGSIGFYTNTDTGYNNGGWLKFADNTIQTTAFPPAGGTTSQYIRGDGSLATYGPLGDRYLTTSTTSLLIGNGTKTLTVGTGLSYSPLQEVTIAYNVGNHMHASVTSYNSTTGVMVVDVSKHSGSGTYATWTINVGGVVGGTYLEIANNLSDLQSSTQARVNLGLGTMSTEPASAYLSTASAVANYQTISGMSAYLSTSAASSTYLTQSNASSTYLTQSNASTTYIGTSAYATTAQAQAGTSTTTVVSPSTLLDAKYFQGGVVMNTILWSTATSGAGASAGQQNGNGRLNAAPTSAVGYAVAAAPIVNNSRGIGYGNGYDFSKRVVFGARIARNVTTPDTNSVFRLSIGKNVATTTVGDLSVRGLMVKVAGSGAMQLLVHNGTSLTTTTSSYTPSNNSAYDVVIISDGTGNVTLYVNGSSVATSTGGPTASQGATFTGLHFECENTSTLSNSPQNVCVTNTFVQVNP